MGVGQERRVAVWARERRAERSAAARVDIERFTGSAPVTTAR